MGKFPPCSLNYSVFRDGDVFFAHGSDFIGWLIRVGQNGLANANDLSQPNHAGFIYTIEGQVFAAEVGTHGIELHSLDEYCKTNNQIVGVMRCKIFDNDALRSQWRQDMARWIRKQQDEGYDLNGAIKSALPWWPWGSDPNKEFCSRDVCAWLIKYGCSWLQQALNPLRLFDAMTRRHLSETPDVDIVLGYKNIPPTGGAA